MIKLNELLDYLAACTVCFRVHMTENLTAEVRVNTLSKEHMDDVVKLYGEYELVNVEPADDCEMKIDLVPPVGREE